MEKTCLTCRHAEDIDEDFILDLRGSVVNVDGIRRYCEMPKFFTTGHGIDCLCYEPRLIEEES